MVNAERRMEIRHEILAGQRDMLLRASRAKGHFLPIPYWRWSVAACMAFWPATKTRTTTTAKKFPGVLLRVRADSGFARPLAYETCERLDVDYWIGIGMNPVLKRHSDELLQIAVQTLESTGEPQRLFTGFDYQASTGPSPRWVVVKCEANAQGTNRRAVVTNRRLIKVAARITVTARRVRVFLSASWPFLNHFRDAGRAVLDST